MCVCLFVFALMCVCARAHARACVRVWKGYTHAPLSGATGVAHTFFTVKDRKLAAEVIEVRRLLFII